MVQKNKKESYYDESAKEVDPLQPAFTRRREAFVGRLAMVTVSSLYLLIPPYPAVRLA